MNHMVATFSLSTEYSASAPEMFDASLDINVHLESMRHSKESAIGGVTTGTIGLGDTVTWRARHFGLWFTMTSKITTLERPLWFVDEQVTGPFETFVHEHYFEDTRTGCRMTDKVTVASPVLALFAERVVLVPYLRHLIQRRNDTLALVTK